MYSYMNVTQTSGRLCQDKQSNGDCDIIYKNNNNNNNNMHIREIKQSIHLKAAKLCQIVNNNNNKSTDVLNIPT